VVAVPRGLVSPFKSEDNVPGNAIAFLVSLLNIYSLVILARVLLSWFPGASPRHPVVHAIYVVTEPVLDPVRRVLPPMGTVDLSPLVVFFGIYILRSILVGMAQGM
jgi:YggT family protein